MERAFRVAQQHNEERGALLLLGAVNDSLHELGLFGVKAASYHHQRIFLQADSPTTRVMVLARYNEVVATVKEIYRRRGGELPWRGVVIRVSTN